MVFLHGLLILLGIHYLNKMPVNENLKPSSAKHITPEKVVEILKANGAIVTLEEAAKILDFMRSLVKIAIDKDASNNEDQ